MNDVLDDEEINELMDIDNDYRLPPMIDNVTADILKTEIHICPQCMYPDIIGTEPYNRRKIEPRQLRLDDITHSAFKHFCNMHKLNQNAGLALLLKIASDPNNSKMIMSSFDGISKRKGKTNRSKTLLS